MNNSPFTFISDKIINSLEWVEFKETAQWCKDNIYLSSEASPYTGMISFERTPWIEEILNDWDKKWIEEHDIMASTQVGKTTIEFCCIAKELDTDPTMMQLTIPIEDGVSDYISTKFDPFFKGIKSLQEKMTQRKEEEKTRLKGALKEVPGGKLFILGNTENNRRSKTVKNKFMDEVALFGKGHVSELRGRTKFYEKTGRKIFLVSSRKHEGDEIELAYNEAYCKKELQIECKGCGVYFYPVGSEQFKYLTEEEYKKQEGVEFIENRVAYKKAAKDTGRVVCKECKYETTSKDIEDLVREKKVKLIIVEGEDEDIRHGYKLNALATALTNYSTIVQELIDADDDVEKLQTIYQDYFNELYEVKHEEKEDSDMLLLGSGVPEYIIPKDTVAVYLTIDNQLDHLYAQITAIEYGMKVHIVYFSRIESWSDAERLFEVCQNLQGENGEVYTVSKMGIDRRGYNVGEIRRTDEADEFVHYMTNLWGQDRVYTMEGHPDITGGKSYTVGKRKDNSDNRKKLDVKIIKFSNIYMKHKLFSYMERTIQKARAEEGDEEYSYNEKMLLINQDNIERDMESITDHSLTRMLSAEVYGDIMDEKTKKPTGRKGYIPIRKRNDAIDTTTMALTLAEMDMVSMMQKPEEVDIKSSLDRLGSF